MGSGGQSDRARELDRARYRRDRSKRLAAVVARQAKDPSAGHARSKAWRASHPDLVIAHNRRKSLQRYGLTPAAYDAMVTGQGGLCATCRRPPKNTGWLKLRVDHCHTTGRVRGLLCHNCNAALGMVRDSQDTLRAMIEYLK